MAKEIETLTEDERRALRGSKFAPLPSIPRTSHSQPRFFFPLLLGFNSNSKFTLKLTPMVFKFRF